MSVPEHGPAGGATTPIDADATQRLREMRGTTAELMEQLLAATQSGDITFEPAAGTELLVFWCHGIPCALALTALREVLPAVPSVVYLPFSPAWMLGIFPLRNELVGLVDPAPLLCGPAVTAVACLPEQGADLAASPVDLPGMRPVRTALVVGAQDRCLAWVVDAVGEIANAPEESLHAVTETDWLAPDPPMAGMPILPRYIAGVYTGPTTGQDYVVLRADAVLDDLLTALAESGDAPHG